MSCGGHMDQRTKERELGREPEMCADTDHGYMPLLEWLAGRFQGVSPEFREFVEKEHPVVS